VLADGDIHVYGSLAGRAVAGLRGNSRARIFAQSFNATLVAIGGEMVVVDEHPELAKLRGKAVHITRRPMSANANAKASRSKSLGDIIQVVVRGENGTDEIVLTSLPALTSL
jgi:hypothetical protein